MLLLVLALFASSLLGQISGTLLSEPGSEPVFDAEVSLEARVGGVLYSARAYSDASGKFRFEELPPGAYWLKVRAAGCAPLQPQRINIKSGASRSNLVYRLERSGSLSGRVTTIEGEPLPAATVQLLQPTYHRGKLYWSPVNNLQTNDRGEFRFQSVEPGVYRMRAFMFSSLRLNPFSNDLKSSRGLPSFYPGNITVAPGGNLTSLDIAMPFAPSLTLKAHITGKPAGAFQFQLIPDNELLNDTNNAMVVRSTEDIVEIRDVAPGDYRLLARIGSHTANVPVSLHGDTEVSVALVPPVTVSGEVIFERQNDAFLSVLSAKMVAGDRFSIPPLQSNVTPEGRFAVAGVSPGIWDAGVEPLPKGYYIRSMTFEGRDVLVDDVVITSDSRGPLKIAISADGASVEGEVDANSGVVILAPKRRDAWGFYNSASIDADGRFRIDGVAPGEYRAFALETYVNAAVQSAAFLSRLDEWGVAVSLAAKDSKSVSLRRIPLQLLRIEP